MLPEGSPISEMVVESLENARADIMFSDPATLNFIYDPLRGLVRNQHRDLVGILKHLAVLETRFHRQYLRVEETDWTCDFDTDTDFFDRLATMSPRDLAGFLTESDLDVFRLLDPQSIIDEGPHLQHMHRQWNKRCLTAQESIIVEIYLSARLADLAQASISFDVTALRMLTPQSGITH